MAALSLSAFPACKSSSSEEKTASASERSTGGPEEVDQGPAKPTQRTKMMSYRPLEMESARAELDVGGLLIDFGTADQHKYTRGGWKTGWGTSNNDGSVSFAQSTERKSDVDLVVPEAGAVAEVVIRARSAVAGQVLTVYVDGGAIGNGTLTADWSVIRVPAKGLEPGRHGIDFVYSKPGDVRADIDWLWLSRTAGAAEPTVVPRVIPVKVGKRPKRSLIAPTSRSYSYYVQVPDKSKLVFDFGSDKGASFKVTAQKDSEPAKELWSGKADKEWQEVVVDLGEFANTPIRLSLTTEGEAGVAGWGAPEIMLDGVTPYQAKEGKRPKNVIVLLMDTARADSYAPYFPGNEVNTPVFDELAAQSVVFPTAYSQENWTKPAVATVLTGTYSDTHKTQKDASALPAEVQMITERLKGEGFQTAGFVANGYISDKFGFQRGWDTFKNYIRDSLPSQAEYVFGDSLAWIKENKDKGKFFLYMQTIDPHVPYRHKGDKTDQYFEGKYTGGLGKSISAEQQIALSKKPPSETDRKWVQAMYRGEVTHHDDELGKFLTEIKSLGLLEDTIIIITNDHGEEHGEHGRFGHGHSLYDELIRAPLLIHYPAMLPPGSIDEVAENVDIAPTIVDFLGLEPLAGADGFSLLPLLKGEPVQRPYYSISEFMDSWRAVRVGTHKMIFTGNVAKVFDIAKDRTEQEDVAATAVIARRLLEVHGGEAQAAFDKKQRMQDISTKRQVQAGKADIDPETRKQLEALGYFGE